jgi:hypothetical protein
LAWLAALCSRCHAERVFSTLPVSFAGFMAFAMVFSVGLALIPASIAGRKGHSFAAFWLFGVFLLVPAIIVAVLIQDRSGYGASFGGLGGGPPRGTCVRCGESVPVAAAVCRFCGQHSPVQYGAPLRP